MDLYELKRRVSQGEGQYLEFKKKANHPEKIIKELVAFANSCGGLLVLGVDDDGTLSGTRDIEGEAFILEDAIGKWIRPQLRYEKKLIKLNAKKGVALFQIEESQRKPHFVRLPEDQTKGTVYVRSADQSLQASREMREIMRRRLRPKDIQFTFGDKEKVLMTYLEDHDHITLGKFKDIASLNRFAASRTLIRLVLANVLDITPKETEDWYFLKSE